MCAVTISDDFHRWGSLLMAQLEADAVNTELRRSPEDRDNRSTHLLVESDLIAYDLVVWDSGDAELMVSDERGIVPTHLDIGADLSARALFERFVSGASRVAGRQLQG
jgi:hypothetical protein